MRRHARARIGRRGVGIEIALDARNIPAIIDLVEVELGPELDRLQQGVGWDAEIEHDARVPEADSRRQMRLSAEGRQPVGVERACYLGFGQRGRFQPRNARGSVGDARAERHRLRLRR